MAAELSGLVGSAACAVEAMGSAVVGVGVVESYRRIEDGGRPLTAGQEAGFAAVVLVAEPQV